MEPRFLLDTNICIYIRQAKPASVLHRFGSLRAGEAALSVITYGELFFGAQRSASQRGAVQQLKELLELLPALPLPAAAGEIYGKVRAELAAKGSIIDNNDLWIAAHALSSGLILVANNEREFRRVQGLKIENWAE